MTPAPLILVVDDHADTRHLLTRILQRIGYGAAAVADGHQALLFINEHRPNLIILDRMMPVIDGFQVLRTLRNDARHADLPVILYSAAADPESARQALQLGAQSFVAKGTDWQKLALEIERLAGPPPADTPPPPQPAGPRAG